MTWRAIAPSSRSWASGARAGPPLPQRLGTRIGRGPRKERRETMSIALEPEATKLSVTVGEKEITFETGVIAKQAHGAVIVQLGGTVVLATAVGRTEGREGADFFPLTVDVEEKMYAAGKIPGGFFKREGRAGEKAILTARMVDRPIRPLWPKGYKNEVQVIVTTLSADQVHGARHPRHQRRQRGADAVPDAVHGPGGRRSHRPRRRRVPGQPDHAGAQGVDARPDRLRHARGDHDGRGRRARRSPRTC